MTTALVMIGMLILVPSGLCTAIFGILLLRSDFFWWALELGLPTMAVGGALLYLGIKLQQRDSKE